MPADLVIPGFFNIHPLVIRSGLPAWAGLYGMTFRIGAILAASLALGWLVDQIGFQAALIANSGAILICVLVLSLRGRLWHLGGA